MERFQLELADGAFRHVEDKRSDGFVRDVLAVNKNTCGAAIRAVDAESGVARLSGIEGLAGLEDDAGLNLRDVENVAAVNRKRFDLLGGDNAGHAGLFGVDLNFTGGVTSTVSPVVLIFSRMLPELTVPSSTAVLNTSCAKPLESTVTL